MALSKYQKIYAIRRIKFPHESKEQSAIIAGYSSKSAKSKACYLETVPEIALAIASKNINPQLQSLDAGKIIEEIYVLDNIRAIFEYAMDEGWVMDDTPNEKGEYERSYYKKPDLKIALEAQKLLGQSIGLFKVNVAVDTKGIITHKHELSETIKEKLDEIYDSTSGK